MPRSTALRTCKQTTVVLGHSGDSLPCSLITSRLPACHSCRLKATKHQLRQQGRQELPESSCFPPRKDTKSCYWDRLLNTAPASQPFSLGTWRCFLWQTPKLSSYRMHSKLFCSPAGSRIPGLKNSKLGWQVHTSVVGHLPSVLGWPKNLIQKSKKIV